MAEAVSTMSYAESAGSTKSFPIELNEKSSINDKIIDIKDVGIIKNDSISKELIKFYKEMSKVNSEYVKSDSELSNTEYIKNNFLTNYKNIIYVSKTNPDKVIMFSNYDDSEGKGFNNMSYSSETYQLFDYNFTYINSNDEAQELVDEDVVTGIQDIIDGTCIIMVINNGNVTIRTTRTFEAEGKYDSDKSHSEIFEEICNDKELMFSNFIEYSKETPSMIYCFHIGMQLNYTPFPKSIKNDLFLLKAFVISDKTDQLSIFNRKMSEIIEIGDNESVIKEKQIEMDDYIEKELVIDYIKQLDINDVVSLLHNIKVGMLSTPPTYSYNSSDSVKSQIDCFMKTKSHEYKGLIIETETGKSIELINPFYEDMTKLRIKYSIYEKDNDKNLFLQYLFLLYKNNELETKAIETGNVLEKKDLASSKFYEVYGAEKYQPILENIQKKVIAYFDLSYETYMNIHKHKTIPFNEVPPCFRYYNIKLGKPQNLINKIHYDIYIENKRTNPRFAVQKYQIRDYMLHIILKQYYEESINKSYGVKTLFTISPDLFNRILNPITSFEKRVEKKYPKTTTFNLL
jgi:hypothetical protein